MKQKTGEIKKGYENVGNRWAKCQQCVYRREVTELGGGGHIQYALLNNVSDKCDNAVGYGARIHIHTHTHTCIHML